MSVRTVDGLVDGLVPLQIGFDGADGWFHTAKTDADIAPLIIVSERTKLDPRSMTSFANFVQFAVRNTMLDPLLLERRGAVAIISINDAPYNRMTLEFMDRLERILDELEHDNNIRALVFTAAGVENFSVGMNLKQLPDGIKAKGSLDGFFDQRLRVLSKIENLGKPSIATLFGYCLGGGLELPLSCHFRLAAEEGALIGLPEMDLGAVPGWGGTARLARCVGRDHALDLILRGKKISGPEAHRIGLVTEVWPLTDLKDKAISLAEELAGMPRLAVKGVLDCIIGFESKTLLESLSDERRALLANMDTADAKEGMMAFIEKRKPVFNRSDR